MVDFVKAASADLPSHLKLLIYGDSGAGKTWASASAPNPAIMLTERNGMQSIKHSNSEAVVAYCSTANDCRDFLLAAMNSDLPDHVETVVIDSLTEIQQIMIDDILAQKVGENRTMTLPDWGILSDRMRRFFRCIRDLPYHVVCTALVEHAPNEASGETRVLPQFQGKKLASQVAQFFNVVGFLFKREAVDGETVVIERLIMLEGPNRYMVKPCEPLTGVRDTDLASWVQEFVSSEPSVNGKKSSSDKTKRNVRVVGGK